MGDMITDDIFHNELIKLQEEANNLTENSDQESIKVAAKALKAMNYTPTLLFDTPHFLDFAKQDLLNEINHVADLTKKDASFLKLEDDIDFNEVKLTHIRLLINHFKLLTRLRNDEDEAWEEVNELYEDD